MWQNMQIIVNCAVKHNFQRQNIVKKLIQYGRSQTKKIKKCNRNIIAVKTVKWYNL